MKPRTVVIADDHHLFRDGLALLVSSVREFSVIGQASTADEAVAQVGVKQPDVLTLDVEMPGEPVFGTIRRLRRAAERTRIVILTMYADRVLEHQLLDAGAAAFLSKTAPRSAILSALRPAASLSGSANEITHRAPFGGLTIRELQVLRLLGQAKSNVEIAGLLSIAEGTVKRHTGGIYQKLEARSRMDAVVKARLAGLLDQRDL